MRSSLGAARVIRKFTITSIFIDRSDGEFQFGRKMSPRYPLNSMLEGPQDESVSFGEQTNKQSKQDSSDVKVFTECTCVVPVVKSTAGLFTLLWYATLRFCYG
jgi:hypothetical protein